MANANAVGWFEVPVTNMERAMKFYETVLNIQLNRQKMDALDMAWFPWDETGTGSSGSLCCHPDYYKPSPDGVLIYFTCPSGDLANELSKVESAGGKVLMPKTLINEEYGYYALILDTEGNRVSLHSRK
ncbi:MAG: VOC family protein [Bacteroidetes bacterium]|nr:MAG: VOC family protein [Bacteroidota bacterium]